MDEGEEREDTWASFGGNGKIRKHTRWQAKEESQDSHSAWKGVVGEEKILPKRQNKKFQTCFILSEDSNGLFAIPFVHCYQKSILPFKVRQNEFSLLPTKMPFISVGGGPKCSPGRNQNKQIEVVKRMCNLSARTERSKGI